MLLVISNQEVDIHAYTHTHTHTHTHMHGYQHAGHMKLVFG